MLRPAIRPIRSWFPIATQLAAYDAPTLRADVSAGLTVGVMLIPQGMAYALIAGLPPVYGLYAALVPLLIYGLLGSSRQLAVGPVAMVSLLVATGIAPLAAGNPDQAIALALGLALLVGGIQLGLGLLRFGFVTNFLSHPVLSGFTSAAALIIGLNQAKHLFGVPVSSGHSGIELAINAAVALPASDPTTLITGLAAIVLLVGLRRWKRAIPGALVVVVLGTLASWLLNFDARGVATVGFVPGGLPHFSVPAVTVGDLQSLLPAALAIALVGFMESIAVAKSFAAKHRYAIDSNTELRALGMANLVGAFFLAYPTTGGFSRTAVNDQAGARTTVASLISAGVIALTLTLLTPLFRSLPNAILGAVIVVAVAGLFNYREMGFLWKVKRIDFALLLLTFGSTLALGIEEGILIGVIASLIAVIHQSSRPHTAVLGRLPGTRTFRNVLRNPDAETIPGTLLFRSDAALYFANASFVRSEILAQIDNDPSIRSVCIDAYPINRIDATAAHALSDLHRDLDERNVRLAFAGLKGPVRDVLERAGVLDHLGPDSLFNDVADYVDAAASATESARN